MGVAGLQNQRPHSVNAHSSLLPTLNSSIKNLAKREARSPWRGMLASKQMRSNILWRVPLWSVASRTADRSNLVVILAYLYEILLSPEKDDCDMPKMLVVGTNKVHFDRQTTATTAQPRYVRWCLCYAGKRAGSTRFMAHLREGR